MRGKHSPLVLWDYCVERRALIMNAAAKNLFQLRRTNPHTATFANQINISSICQFVWYKWVYFRDSSVDLPYNQEVLGHILGPAKNEGNEMAQWILKLNDKVVPRRTCRRLKPDELAVSNEAEAIKRAEFDASIKSKLGDSFTIP